MEEQIGGCAGTEKGGNASLGPCDEQAVDDPPDEPPDSQQETSCDDMGAIDPVCPTRPWEGAIDFPDGSAADPESPCLTSLPNDEPIASPMPNLDLMRQRSLTFLTGDSSNP